MCKKAQSWKHLLCLQEKVVGALRTMTREVEHDYILKGCAKGLEPSRIGSTKIQLVGNV